MANESIIEVRNPTNKTQERAKRCLIEPQRQLRIYECKDFPKKGLFGRLK